MFKTFKNIKWVEMVYRGLIKIFFNGNYFTSSNPYKSSFECLNKYKTDIKAIHIVN